VLPNWSRTLLVAARSEGTIFLLLFLCLTKLFFGRTGAEAAKMKTLRAKAAEMGAAPPVLRIRTILFGSGSDFKDRVRIRILFKE